MPRFICTNEQCGKQLLIPKVKFVWNDRLGKLVSDYDECSECGSPTEVEKEEGPIAMPWFKAENSRNYQNKRPSKRTNEFNY